MSWENWIAVPMQGDPLDGGLMECTPVEIADDGTQSIVIGMCLITNLPALVQRGAKRVMEVTDTFEPKPIRRLHWAADLK